MTDPIKAPQPGDIPVIDVGGSKDAPIGEVGSQFIRPAGTGAGGYTAAGGVPLLPPPPQGETQVQDDFLRGRAAAQAPQDGAAALKDLLARHAAPQGTEGAPAPAARPVPPAGVWDRIKSVMADVGEGLGHAPTQVLGGVIDAANGIVRFADDAVKAAEEAGLPNVYVRLFDKQGNFAPAVLSTEEFRQAQASGADDVFQFPTTAKAETVTGEMIRTLAEFLAARGNLAGRLGGGILGNATADAVAGGTAMDPNAPRLSNLIQEVAPNWMTDFLQAKPGQETALVGRLKSALEYAGIGAAINGVVSAAKAAKAAIGKQAATPQPAAKPAALGEKPPQGEAPEVPPAAPQEADVLQTGDLWRMSREQLENLLQDISLSDDEKLVRALGEAGAAEFKKLERAARSMNTARADEAARAMDALEAKMTPAQRRLVYGIGEAGPSSDEIKTVLAAHDLVGAGPPGQVSIEHLAWEATLGLRKIAPEKILGVPNGGASAKEQAAYLRLMHGIGLLKEAGVSSDELPSVLVKGMAKVSGMSEADAAEFVREFLKVARAERPASAGSTRPALPGGEPLGADGMPPESPEGAAVQAAKDQAEAAIEITGDVRQAAEDFLAGKHGPNPIKVNLDYIGSGEDIQKALELVSSHLPKQEVQSNAMTAAMADALGMSPQDVLRGYAGQQLDAVQITAMRFMLDSSAEQLVHAAEAATGATASPETMARFLRAFATHRALQQYFENARAEAGRTLQAFQIGSRTSYQQTQAIKAIIDLVGDDAADLAEKVAKLADPLKVSRFVAGAAKDRGGWFMQAYYNALLSNPRTIVKKLISDIGMAFWNIAVRQTAEAYGASGEVAAGEAAALMSGYVGAMRDGFRVAGRALAAGRSQLHGEAATLDLGNKAARLAEGTGEALPSENPLPAMVNWWRAALPTSWIGAADDFAKFVNYRAELRALAFRDGSAKGLGGEDMATHIAQTMDAPPAAMHDQAWAAALRNTFQDPLTGPAKGLQTLIDSMEVPIAGTDAKIPVGRFLMPFVKVPANIAAWSYRNTALSPLMPSEAWKGAMAAGGAQRDLAIARVTLGTGAAWMFLDLVLGGTMTGKGPSDPELRRAWEAAGNQPYSVRIHGTWYSYRNLEPMGMMIGAIADTFDVMRFAREDDRDNAAASAVFGVGNALLSKTYMESLAGFFDALANPEQDGKRWVERMAGSMAVPAGVAATASAIDPWVRAHYTLLDAIERRVPFVSEKLPYARTLWGDPVPTAEGFLPGLSGSIVADILSPIGTKPDSGEPIDRWIWDNHSAFPRADSNKLGLRKLGQFQSFGQGPVQANVELTPAEHDRLQVLAGNALKDPQTNLGAKDTLNALVEGRHPDPSMQRQWDLATPAARALIVRTVVDKFRAAARKTLLQEFPDLLDAVTAQLGNRVEQLVPSGKPGPATGARVPTLDGARP